MKYIPIFLLTFLLSIIIYFVLGAVGLQDYIDGLVISVGLIIVALLSIIISLLVNINRKLNK
ncbi:hypothetical protein MHH85_05055 [Viridibacillus sp. FSL E2-0187]|uniref:hypothetical protein n=1 Tax=Viridibacillus sp. FSL E2-0187 TaxID=2921362 RepID=UPI0030F79CDE